MNEKKCDICGTPLNLTKENINLVKDVKMTGRYALYDAVGCEQCGYQSILKEKRGQMMDEKKVREAIKELKTLTYVRKQALAALPASVGKDSLYNYEIVALETGIKALEKQLTKKPVEVNDAYTPKIGEFRVAKCPNCGHEVSDRFDVCLECGQKLDWSE